MLNSCSNCSGTTFDCTVLLDWAKTEKEYTHFLKNNYYDAILADYTLPGFNAEEALKIALSTCPQTPFIIVSGTIGEDVVAEILRQGATDYVLKDKLSRLPIAVSRAILEVEREKRTGECS